MRSSNGVGFIVVALGLVACGRNTKVQYGDPVGVRVTDPSDPASPTELEAAFAVSAGQSPDRLIPAVARLVHDAAKACPALGALTKRGEALRFSGRLEGGLLVLDDQGSASEDIRCVRSAVANQRLLGDAEARLSMVVEISAPRTAVTP